MTSVQAKFLLINSIYIEEPKHHDNYNTTSHLLFCSLVVTFIYVGFSNQHIPLWGS